MLSQNVRLDFKHDVGVFLNPCMKGLLNTYMQEGCSRENETIDQRGDNSAATHRSAKNQQ